MMMMIALTLSCNHLYNNASSIFSPADELWTKVKNTYILKLILVFLLMSNQQDEEEEKDGQTSREEQELEDEEKYDTL